MFNCVICNKVYAHKRDLNRHAKSHDGSINSCGLCLKTFTRRDKLKYHVQNLHAIAKNTAEYHNAVQIGDGGAMGRASVKNWAPLTTTPHTRPDVPTPAVVFTRHTDTPTSPQALPSISIPSISTEPPAQVITTQPDCRLLVRMVEDNSDPEYPQYTSFISRLKTFDSHPTLSGQDKYSLAEGGFIYTGTDDLVQCHYCGILLGKWEENDEVWQQHALHNPECVFVLLYKGAQFIENVNIEFNAKRNTRDNSQDRRCKSESYDVG